MKYRRLGDLLVEAGAIDEAQLAEALELQKETRLRLGETLIEMDALSERQLMDALSVQLGVEQIDLTAAAIPPDMTRVVPRNLVREHAVVPVRVKGDDLYLAMADPLNFIAIEEVEAVSRRHVIPMIATQSAVQRAIVSLYGNEGAERAILEMQADGGVGSDFTVGTRATQLDSEAENAPTIRLVDNIIERGIAERASDIHVEPLDEYVNVRLRIDGVLHNALNIPKELQQPVAARIKVMCDMDVTERRRPQDGRAIVTVRDREVDLRVSTLPTVHGEKIVLRILDRSAQRDTAEELGFSGVNLEKYNRLLENRQGVILIVGPTGSGKSSTMSTMIQRLNTESVNIVSLEDPVEYNILGVNQVQVNEKTGVSFASGLRAILRQDPDIVGVGEIRDAETADIAMRAAVTGHLVLSTIHTSDAVSTIDRLHDIGVEDYMMASALNGVISQRLVRRICPYCREEYEPSAEEAAQVGLEPGGDLRFSRGAGCPECFGSGYRGRIVVAEILMIDEGIRRVIHEHAGHGPLMEAVRASGFVPILENCRELVASGVTTAQEAFSAVNSGD